MLAIVRLKTLIKNFENGVKAMSHPDAESEFQAKLEKAFDEAEQSEPLCPFCDRELSLITVFNEMRDTITNKSELVPKTHWCCNNCDKLFL